MLNQIVTYLLYPLVLPLNILLKLAIYKARKDSASLGNGEEVVKVVQSDFGQTPLTVKVPREAELDFIDHRSITYVGPSSWGVARQLADLLLQSNKPEPIDEHILVRMFTETSGSQITYWDEKRQCYVADFSCYLAGVWEGYYQDVLEFEFDVKRAHYAIIDREGNRYTPDDPNWNSCLLHIALIYTIVIPLAAHSWMHFGFPDGIADMVNHKLPRNTFLYQLLAPHCRFTNRINYQALWVNKSTKNYPDLRHSLVPWLCMPTDVENVRKSALYNITKHYKEINQHFSLPEDLDGSIPYYFYLKSYFPAIENFLKKISHYIEEDAYNMLADYMETYYPGFKQIDKVRVLSVFIWHVGIWHLLDHQSYVPYVRKYGFTVLRKPITDSFSAKEISSYNRYRVNNFLNVFARFNPNPNLDQRLLNIESYGFTENSEPHAAAVAFREDLIETDRRLKEKGMAFLPVEEHIQSICF